MDGVPKTAIVFAKVEKMSDFARTTKPRAYDTRGVFITHFIFIPVNAAAFTGVKYDSKKGYVPLVDPLPLVWAIA